MHFYSTKMLKKTFLSINFEILEVFEVFKRNFMEIHDTSKNPLQTPQTTPQNFEGLFIIKHDIQRGTEEEWKGLISRSNGLW